MKVKDLQNCLLKFFEGNSKTAKLLNYAHIFVYIYLGLTVLDIFNVPYPLSRVIAYISIITDYLFVIGAVMTFSKNKYMPVVAIFGVKCVDLLIYLIRSFHALPLIRMLVYAVVTYGLFKLYLHTTSNAEQTYTDANVNTNNVPNIVYSNSQDEKNMCTNCGNELKNDDLFCEKCGARVR